jgi:hypothetical protein
MNSLATAGTTVLLFPAYSKMSLTVDPMCEVGGSHERDVVPGPNAEVCGESLEGMYAGECSSLRDSRISGMAGYRDTVSGAGRQEV